MILDRVLNVLRKIGDRVGFRGHLRSTAQEALDLYLQEMAARQPYGHIEHNTGQTVSERLGHTPISQGWQSGVEDTSEGVRIWIGNISEHIAFYVGKTRRHPIPASPDAFCYYWWGSPHPWPALDGRAPGMRKHSSVPHPGTQANPFPQEAADAVLDSSVVLVKEGIAGFIKDAMLDEGLTAA